ncbi:hypothetical protein [Nitratiruptor sp. YY09-18]|uniref:hypothetical protein n=1 Tax=Nitratiruptor sp. YY09-18 TaxID=2724901 RepID=UPI0019167530|nr:hypothetical protein [Nitratiruptor sp. YY09-18]BCD67953.1 hypothetical protein NitYY0918_C0861 [Nitratiruptor sp. YY09-18]
MLARIEKYKFLKGSESNKNRLNFLNKVVINSWLNIPAWHWVKMFPNMKLRTLAKLNKDPSIAGKSYYYAIIDEDIFLFGITANLVQINACKNKELCQEILEIGYKIFKKKIHNESEFSYAKGEWYEHPDYLYAGYEKKEFPKYPCPNPDMELDISHFHRMPWIFSDMYNVFKYLKEINKANYFDKSLREFYNKFNKKLVVYNQNGLPLLKNFIDGSNGWYRVRYHKNYPNFGYGPFELSLVAVLGSYYYKNFDKKFICSMNRLLSTNNNLKKYYDEKYPTSFTKTLKKFGIFEKRFKYYELLNRLILYQRALQCN